MFGVRKCYKINNLNFFLLLGFFGGMRREAWGFFLVLCWFGFVFFGGEFLLLFFVGFLAGFFCILKSGTMAPPFS